MNCSPGWFNTTGSGGECGVPHSLRFLMPRPAFNEPWSVVDSLVTLYVWQSHVHLHWQQVCLQLWEGSLCDDEHGTRLQTMVQTVLRPRAVSPECRQMDHSLGGVCWAQVDSYVNQLSVLYHTAHVHVHVASQFNARQLLDFVLLALKHADPCTWPVLRTTIQMATRLWLLNWGRK